MEQAVNLFSKGLLVDTHPMILGNDTLSDALNATFVTMAGNEVILQNDMGNRKVDEAFLPAGYEPVGIKEYGGVIYIAAYNPITNRSQIGSFPSPERNFTADEISPSDSLDFSIWKNYSNQHFCVEDLEGIKFLTKNSFLKLLTENVNLRAGDKFVIYSTGISNIKDDISNYNNINEEGEISDFKNKKYTLSIGVLNSQNEFVDITKTLMRFDEEGNIIKKGDIPDETYFNSGYFILNKPYEITSNIDRQLLNINTYSYKLIGPLYLKASLNTIESFTYTIGITKNNNIITINIVGNISYNCPDEYIGFDLFLRRVGELNYVKKSISNDKIIFGDSKYNSDSNLYSKLISKTYTFTLWEDIDEVDYDYYICPTNIKEGEESYYVKDLSYKGTLSVGLINSGEIKLDIWRYLCAGEESLDEDGNTIVLLEYQIQAYPRSGESFENLKLKYVPIGSSEEPKEITLIEGELFTGNYTYAEYLPKDKMLLVSLEYTTKVSYTNTSYTCVIGNINPNDENIQYTQERLWILTTKFFNDYYYSDPKFYEIDKVEISLILDKDLVSVDNIQYNDYNKISGDFYSREYKLEGFNCINNIKAECTINTPKNIETQIHPEIPESIAHFGNGQYILAAVTSEEIPDKEITFKLYSNYDGLKFTKEDLEISLNNRTSDFNTKYDIQFKLPFKANCTETTRNVPVKNYLISVRNYIYNNLNTLMLTGTYLNLEFSGNDLAVWKGNTLLADGNLNLASRVIYPNLEEGDTINLKNHINDYTECFDGNTELSDKIIFGGVGQDAFATRGELNNYGHFEEDSTHVLKVWMRYRESVDDIPKWAILCELKLTGDHYDIVTLDGLLGQIKSWIYPRRNTDEDYYGVFGESSKLANVYIASETAYNYIEEASFNLYINYSIVDNREITNVYENLLIPEFTLVKNDTVDPIILEINSKNQNNNYKFIEDISSIQNPTIEYWMDEKDGFIFKDNFIPGNCNLFFTNNFGKTLKEQYDSPVIERFGPSLRTTMTTKSTEWKYLKNQHASSTIAVYNGPKIFFGNDKLITINY